MAETKTDEWTDLCRIEISGGNNAINLVAQRKTDEPETVTQVVRYVLRDTRKKEDREIDAEDATRLIAMAPHRIK